MRGVMRQFFRYLKGRKRVISVFLVFCLIHFTVFALYRLPIMAAAYPMCLCFALGLAVLAWDYCRVSQQHRTLSQIQTLTDAMLIPLPQAEGVPEEDYQEIIRLLCREQRRRVDEMNGKYQDMVDYYTTWAHQIKTPIASMKLHLQNEDTALSRQLSSDLMRVEQYVEMVLMFLRLDSDATDYVIREQDLDAILRQAVRKFAGEFIARRLTLVYEPVNAQVITDEKWLSFVIEQVLSNALKYTSSGSIHIYLEEPRTLCIRDTGIGIAAEDLPRIFEKGYTGCNGRSDKKASGIGLYLCRRICRNLGHGISAASKPDEGTTIRIMLEQRRLEVE